MVDNLSSASRLSFSSLPSISSRAENHRDLLKDRRAHLMTQLERVRNLLEEAEEGCMPPLHPLQPELPLLPTLRQDALTPGRAPGRGKRQQTYQPESIDEDDAMEANEATLVTQGDPLMMTKLRRSASRKLGPDSGSLTMSDYPFKSQESNGAIRDVMTPFSGFDAIRHDANTPFGGNGALRPWKHYLFRNLVPTPLPQSRYPRTIRQPTPMKWGYPGAMSQVSYPARVFSCERLPTAPGNLSNSVSAKAILGTSLVVYSNGR